MIPLPLRHPFLRGLLIGANLALLCVKVGWL